MLENQNIEYKQNWHDEYIKWICGFANANGGKIYIGKDDNGKVVGISDTKKLLIEIPNKVKDILGIIIDVNLLEENNLPYIEIIIEPYPYPINYKGQYHYRSGSTKQELKGAALNKFLLEKSGKRWDSVIIPDCKISDLDIESLKRYQEKASQNKRINKDEINDSFETLLDKLHLLEKTSLKRAAVLLFHPEPERFIQGAYIKVGFFRKDDDITYQDEIHGNLIEQIDKTKDLLKTKYFVYTISYENMNRKEEPSFPEFTIREALLNAITHKDYSDSTPIQISVYEDHIVFWNPGKLPENWTTETLTQKHPSKPFNPEIANALFRSGDIESWGRGTLKMIAESVEKKTLPPIFKDDYSGLMVLIYKNARSLLIKESVPNDLISIIESVLNNGYITNKKVQKLLNISKSTATRYLNELNKNWLIRIGETGKGTKYIIKGFIKGS